MQIVASGCGRGLRAPRGRDAPPTAEMARPRPSPFALLAFVLSIELLASAAAEPLVAVVFGERSEPKEAEVPGPSRARACCQAVEAALKAAGVPYARLADSEAQAGRLRPYKAAILPFNTVLPDPELAAIEHYVKDGGKLILFHAQHESLLGLLGLSGLGRRTAGHAADFATIRFGGEAVQGLPPRLRQGCDELGHVQPTAPGLIALGEWHDAEGRRTGLAAAYVGLRGAYLCHAPTAADPAAQGRLLLAILGHLVPEVWQQASSGAIAAAARVGSLDGFDALARRLDARLPASRRREAARALAEARSLVAEATKQAQAARHAEATDAAREARRRAADAFLLTTTERLGELRAAWLPDPHGLRGLSWEETARRLAACGFNVLLVNFLGAGVAHYPSETLPRSPAGRGKADPLAECLRACRRHGLQLHLWMTCYNLSSAPAELTDQLSAEGRLAFRVAQAPSPVPPQPGTAVPPVSTELLWLCPSHPENLELERDAALEAIRNYAVDGLHLDYAHYPNDLACFCAGCRERFQTASGLKVAKWPDDVLIGERDLRERFAAWRQEQVTALVRAVAVEARRARPGIAVSAAVFPDAQAARSVHGQDWPRWLDERLLDFIVPLDYAADATELEPLVARQVELARGRLPVCAGIAAHRVRDPIGILDQLERARRLGADGFVLYVPDAELLEVASPVLGQAFWASRTAPPFPAPASRFTLPSGLGHRPGLAFEEGSPLTVTAALEARGNFRKPVRRAAGTLRVETADGAPVQRLGRVSSGGTQPARAVLRLPPGCYRLAIEGSVSFGWFSGQPFVVRSRPFEVIARSEAP